MSDPFNPNATGTVKAIEDQGDRVLLYENLTSSIRHYIIATPEQAQGIQVGDRIEYAPIAANASWFVRKVEEPRSGWVKEIRDHYREAEKRKKSREEA